MQIVVMFVIYCCVICLLILFLIKEAVCKWVTKISLGRTMAAYQYACLSVEIHSNTTIYRWSYIPDIEMLRISRCPNIESSSRAFVDNSPLRKSTDLYESSGYRKIDDDLIINRRRLFNSDQPDGPVKISFNLHCMKHVICYL